MRCRCRWESMRHCKYSAKGVGRWAQPKGWDGGHSQRGYGRASLHSLQKMAILNTDRLKALFVSLLIPRFHQINDKTQS